MPAPPCRTHSSHVSSQKSVRPIPNLQCIAHVHAAAAHRQLSLVYLARRCLASEKANRNCQSQPTEASLPHISWPATSRPALQLAGSPPRTRLHIPTRDPHPRPARLSAHHHVPTRLCEIHLISTSAPPVCSAPLLHTLSTSGAPLVHLACTAYAPPRSEAARPARVSDALRRPWCADITVQTSLLLLHYEAGHTPHLGALPGDCCGSLHTMRGRKDDELVLG